MHNENKTCWNCPSAIFKGHVDFRACGQTKEEIKDSRGKASCYNAEDVLEWGEEGVYQPIFDVT